MMIRKGRDAPKPCWSMKRLTSVCAIPSPRPAAVAMGKERKSPTSALASAARTNEVMAATCKVMIGTTRMPAIAAMAEPSAQFSVAMRLGDKPIADAERSLSDTASVASPNWLDRYNAHRAVADATAIPRSIRRSTKISTSPQSVNRLLGSQLST